MPIEKAAKLSRYQRVKEILETAAGDSPADYGGVGRFWNLPLEVFQKVMVHGVRMIAAGSEGSPCCCSPPKSQTEAIGPKFPGRGNRSGLIRGLRGQAPFDGTQFPRLPWGGSSVSETDIQFISDWIEDDCPAADQVVASFDLATMEGEPGFQIIHEIEEIPQLFQVAQDTSPRVKGLHHGLKQRMNLDCLGPEQLTRLRAAFRQLYDLNHWPEDRRNYNNLALIHQNHCQHGWERFLPWHRVYLHEVEQTIQDFFAEVTLPYWDWTLPRYRPEKPECGLIIPEAFKAFLTAESLVNLQNATPPLPESAAEQLVQSGIVGKKFTSPGKFFAEVAGIIDPRYVIGEYRNRFIDELLQTNSLWYPLRYPAEYGGGTLNSAIHYHYPTAADIQQIKSLKTFRDFGGGSLYNDSFGFLDQNPHNTLHLWTGGKNPGYDKTSKIPLNRNHGVKVAGRRFHTRDDLYSQPEFGDMFSNLTASYDPIFWPIHANVDRLWSEWQAEHPNGQPLGLNDVLTPWSYTLGDTLDMSQFGYEYVKSSHLMPVGMETPVSRFVSQVIAIPEAVQAHFEQAEVRLHQVPQLPRSCFIRVFLNLPGANAQTSLQDGRYAGYLAVFGHGPCYGGPGHCDLPPESKGPFDRRARSHNAPRNHRINITQTARKLLDGGAKTLQITLVVVGADYEEDKDLLRLGGVSLNFFD